MFGRKVNIAYRENRNGIPVAICELSDDSLGVLPEWMFDVAFCACIKEGQARASIKALRELRQLLTDLGFCSYCSDTLPTEAQEQINEKRKRGIRKTDDNRFPESKNKKYKRKGTRRSHSSSLSNNLIGNEASDASKKRKR